MKKLIFVICLFVFLTGCSEVEEAYQPKTKNLRFYDNVKISEISVDVVSSQIEIRKANSYAYEIFYTYVPFNYINIDGKLSVFQDRAAPPEETAETKKSKKAQETTTETTIPFNYDYSGYNLVKIYLPESAEISAISIKGEGAKVKIIGFPEEKFEGIITKEPEQLEIIFENEDLDEDETTKQD